MTSQKKMIKRHKSLSILLIYSIASALCSIKYPVSLGGFSGDTVLQLFTIDSSGNLALEGIC